MNLIEKAAEAYYKETGVSNYDYAALVNHFLQFLSQQGDEGIINELSTWHNGYNVQEKIKQALAIGRAMAEQRIKELEEQAEEANKQVTAAWMYNRNANEKIRQLEDKLEFWLKSWNWLAKQLGEIADQQKPKPTAP